MKTWWDGLSTHFESRHTTQAQDWLKDFQKKSFAEFKKLGLPHAKQEAWRATPIGQLFADDYATLPSQVDFIPCQPPEHSFYIGVKGTQLSFDEQSLPQGVTVLPIIDAIEKFPQIFKRYLGQVGQDCHGLSALNSALFDNGVFLHVAKGVNLAQPIFIHHQLVDGCIAHTRHLLVLEEQASATVFEYFDGGEHHPAMLNHVSEMILEDNASACHLKIQQLGAFGKLQSQAFIKQQQSSHFKSFMLQLGGQLSSCDMDVDLQGVHAHADLTGLFLPKGKQFHQQRIHINHQVPDCQSEQNFRGILDEHARGVFVGKVTVAKGADKTEAHQSNKNLLLAKTAQMITAPQLQIFADDVVCSHGATVGQLDDDAIFYLRSRGFSEQLAQAMLVDAFIITYFDSIDDASLKAWCLQKLKQNEGLFYV
jgi:Fe-S cluster assembly protein SufD